MGHPRTKLFLLRLQEASSVDQPAFCLLLAIHPLIKHASGTSCARSQDTVVRKSSSLHGSGQVVAGSWQRRGDGVEERGIQSPLPSCLSSFLLPQSPEDRIAQISPIPPLSTLSPEGARLCAGPAGGQAGRRHEDPLGPGWACPDVHPGEVTPETGSWGWGEVTQRRRW